MSMHAAVVNDSHAQHLEPWQQSPWMSRGLPEVGMALVWALIISVPIFAIGGSMMYEFYSTNEQKRLAAIEAALAYEHLIAAPPLSPVAVENAAHGRDLFNTSCIACHGPTGQGVAGLGKTLVESDFVAGKTDEGLHAFLLTGRPTAKPVAMPPKGGRDDFSDADLRDVIAYVRGLQDPRRMPVLPAPVTTIAPPTEAEKAKALAAAGGNAELAEYIASGTKIFNTTCIACHGAGGVGIAGNGKALRSNDFVKSQSDDALLAFVKHGRDPGDPKNTTGVAMPPRGGNPALSDDDLLDVISYIRTLQASASVTSGKTD